MSPITSPRVRAAIAAAILLAMHPHVATANTPWAPSPPSPPSPPTASSSQSPPSRSSPSSPNAPSQRAERLFVEGRALYDAGRFSAACERLAASQRLEPRVGTLGLLAACEEQRGRLATAYRTYVATAALARRAGDPREDFARGRAAALERRVPTLAVQVLHPEQHPVVLRNGARLPEPDFGVRVPLDPGPIELVATAPGSRPWRTTLTLAPGEHATVDVPRLERDPALAANGTEERATRSRSILRGTGWASGALGLTALMASAVLGGIALANRNASDPFCNAESQCTPRGGELREEARKAAAFSTIAFGVGIAATGAGAALLLLTRDPAPPPAARAPARTEARPARGAFRTTPIVGPGLAGGAIGASF